MFVFGFFSNSFVTWHKEIGYFFCIVCRTESLQPKFVLSHWVTATKRFFVCCTESLLQTKLVYALKKMLKSLNMLHLFGTFCSFWHFFVPFWQFLCLFCTFFLILLTFKYFWCNLYNFCLLQWLSATNKKFICCRDQ